MAVAIRKPLWLRVLFFCFALLMAFALLGGQYVHAEVVTGGLLLFAVSDVLLAILSALGVAAVQNNDWYRTLQANFMRQCITLGLSVGGLIKAWLSGAKTWIDERLVAWVQGQLQASEVGTPSTDLFDYFTPASVSQRYYLIDGATYPFWDVLQSNPTDEQLYSMMVPVVLGPTAQSWTWGRYSVSWVTTSNLVDCSIKAPYLPTTDSRNQYVGSLCPITDQSNPNHIYYDNPSLCVVPAIIRGYRYNAPLYTVRYVTRKWIDGVGWHYDHIEVAITNPGEQAPGTVVDEYSRPVSTGASVCPTYYPDAATYQASDWYGGKADVSADGAADLPLTVADAAAGAWVQDQTAAQAGTTADGKVAEGQGNVQAVTNTQTIDDAVPAVESVTNSLFSRVSLAFNYSIFDKFPFSVPYDMYLFTSALSGSLGDASTGSALAKSSPGSIDLISAGSTSWEPKLDFHTTAQISGASIPIDLSVDLTPYSSLFSMVRVFAGALFLALLLSFHFHSGVSDSDNG